MKSQTIELFFFFFDHSICVLNIEMGTEID
jgi:hypothetical protein